MIRFLEDLVFKDLWLKLLSFGLAVVTWFTVASMATQKEISPAAVFGVPRSEERVFSNLPVVILSSAEDVRLFSVNPKTVELTVQGDVKILKSLQSKDIRVLVDLTGIGAAHELRKRIEVSTPAGVTHMRVSPEEVQVIFPPRTGVNVTP
jgi:YbbR domain-containing protein